MCFSNCPHEVHSGPRWGDCGNRKMQNTPLAHCYEGEDVEEDEDEDQLHGGIAKPPFRWNGPGAN